MKKVLEKKDFNADMAKRKGYEYFLRNVKDLIARGNYTEMIGGKKKTPSESEIKAFYEDLTGLKVEKEAKNG
jgi:hypothetical protein